MRVESSVTSVSWIPSEAVTGPVLKGSFESGFTHYDEPLPETLDALEDLRAEGRFRFANHLAAWADIENGPDRRRRYSGGGLREDKRSDDAFPALAFSALGYASVHHGHNQWDGVAILSRVGDRQGHHRLRRGDRQPLRG